MSEVPDRGGQLLAATWSLTIISFCVMILRGYCKFLRHRGLWYDDYVLIVSWVCLLLANVFVVPSVQLGLGKHQVDIEPTSNLVTITFYGQLSSFFSILAIVWSKTSFALTLLRVTKGWVRYMVWGIIGSMNVLLLGSSILSWTWCRPVNKIWDPNVPGSCIESAINQRYLMVSGTYYGVMDIVLALIPWTIIPQLQMRTKEKMGVAVAMSMGLFAGVTAFVKVSQLQRLASVDFFYDGVDLIIWGAAETATTIVATSIPVLRVLLNEIKSSSGGGNYFKSSSKDQTKTPKTQASRVHTIVTSNRRGTMMDRGDDAASDKDILGRKAQITRTAEVTMTYGKRLSDEESGYEMDQFDQYSVDPATGSGRSSRAF